MRLLLRLNSSFFPFHSGGGQAIRIRIAPAKFLGRWPAAERETRCFAAGAHRIWRFSIVEWDKYGNNDLQIFAKNIIGRMPAVLYNVL